MSTSTAGQANNHTFFGHPRGLATLFFTEMWERFAYYGMRALLILFMTTATDVANPGLGLDVGTAAAIYGLYTSLVYILALPGGWVADNLWGQRKAVFVGGCFIAAGQLSMALGFTPTFFLGLVLIIFGTGLLKPNVSTVVGELYPEGGARRDAGFSIFYMGINLGAFIGPLLTGYFGEGIRWQYGFGIGAIGMIAGLIQYKAGEKYLGDAGLLKGDATADEIASRSRKFFGIFGAVLAAVVAFAYAVRQGMIPLSLTQIATGLGYGVLVLVGLYFVYLWTAGGHTAEENKRLGVIFWLFLLIAVFWSGFEQAGSSLNVFARDLTDRTFFGWLMPASFLQSVNALLIILMAPLFGALWVWLDKRHVNPPLPLKAGMGLLGLSMGFFVIAWGAANASADNLVTPAWLVVTYFLHTVGELCISPIGLSAITKLSPAKRVGQMMGIWFVGAALGNLFAGLVAGRLANLPPAPLFQTVALTIGAVGIFASLASPLVKKLMGGVK
ncbi:MAG: MFS transporter [Gemmatimonadota bacterium]